MNNLRIPLIIDGALLLFVIFQSGIGWARLETLTQDVAALRIQVHAQGDAIPETNERLARIEESVLSIKSAITEIKGDIREQRR